MKWLLKKLLPSRARKWVRQRVLGGEGVHTDGKNFLVVTLDSCRYDVYAETPTPTFDRIATAVRALAPGNFTLPSHIALFMGFTPGDPHDRRCLVNPAMGKFWKVGAIRTQRGMRNLITMDCKNVVDGYNRAGYVTFGTGAVPWFDTLEVSTAPLIGDFQDFYYPGDMFSLAKQLKFIHRKLDAVPQGVPFFGFINVGETHMPYWHEGADWSRDEHPCRRFNLDGTNDAAACRARQAACLRYADSMLASLLDRIDLETTHVLVCADHGDCWGEDGLWGHGITHPKVLEVPLVYRLCTPFPGGVPESEAPTRSG